jgi:hypothetical protein
LIETQTQQQIEAFVNVFNEASLYGDLEALEGAVHEEVIFVYGGFESEIVGKKACLQSIQEYWSVAKTLSFEMQSLKYWEWEGSIQVKFDYEVSYQMEENAHRERGTEIWTVVKVDSQWKLLWRALIFNESV